MLALGPIGSWTAARDIVGPFTPAIVEPQASPRMPSVLRVATFNVEYTTRAEPLAAALRAHAALRRADVLLLQEIEAHPAEDGARAARLAELLGMGCAYTPSRRAGGNGTHGQAILSRWPLHQVEVMELPLVRMPINWGRRIALAAQIETQAGPLRLISVHLDTRINVATRIRQLAPAVAGAQPLQIVGGDMNTLPFHFAGGAVPVLPVDQAGRLDAYMRSLGFATPVSGAGATHRHLIRPRLDAIFTRGFTPASARVARDVTVSDHYPVWVDLEVGHGR